MFLFLVEWFFQYFIFFTGLYSNVSSDFQTKDKHLNIHIFYNVNVCLDLRVIWYNPPEAICQHGKDI